jgi:methyl-accepting chemotaxis protein
VIQQNAGAAEQMSSTAEELSSQAEQLQSNIAFFKVRTTGSARRPAAQRKSAKPVSKGFRQTACPERVLTQSAGHVLAIDEAPAPNYAEFERF